MSLIKNISTYLLSKKERPKTVKQHLIDEFRSSPNRLGTGINERSIPLNMDGTPIVIVTEEKNEKPSGASSGGDKAADSKSGGSKAADPKSGGSKAADSKSGGSKEDDALNRAKKK